MNTHVQTSLSGGCLGNQAQGGRRELGALSCQQWRRLDTRLSPSGSRQRGSTSSELTSGELTEHTQSVCTFTCDVTYQCSVLLSVCLSAIVSVFIIYTNRMCNTVENGGRTYECRECLGGSGPCIVNCLRVVNGPYQFNIS